jgi:hypothetical protein
VEFLAIFLLCTVCVFVLIAVHESGHYLAGLALGIPAHQMQIRLFTFPQHVALRYGDGWVSPADYDPYAETVWKHLTTTRRVYLFVAGGLVLETVFTIIVAVSLVQLGWAGLALAVLSLSLLMDASYLLVDMVMALRTGHAWGDFSGMWFLAKLPTALLVLVLLAPRAALVLWLMA